MERLPCVCVLLLLMIFGSDSHGSEYDQCKNGKKCVDLGARCCDSDKKTLYCLGDHDYDLVWTLAETEKCEQCEKGCFAHYDPKCGTDGITYQNACYLENAMCRKRKLKLSHEGECIGPGSCHLGCADGYQLSYDYDGGLAVWGSYPSEACGEHYVCIPTPLNCAKACPYGYYLCAGYDTTCIQYSACGNTIWCKPAALVPSHCHGTYCLNNGYMTYSARGCFCNCLDGYYGDNCGYRYTDHCSGLQCSNHALVHGTAGGCHCSCAEGYGGPYCQDSVDYLTCGGKKCHNGGILTRGAHGCHCSCLQGFYGEECAQHKDCKGTYCVNGGFVVRTDEGCECSCPFGFYGPKCEYEHFGEWVSIKSRFYDLCLAYNINGNVFVEHCEPGKPSQTFLVKTNYIMTSDERCLELEGYLRTGNVALWPCHYKKSQYWIVAEPAIKTFDRFCLDIEGGLFEGGRNVIGWDCLESENQAWELHPAYGPAHTGPCPAFHCEVDPCEVLRCMLHPQATCEPDYCECRARFHINGHEVTCHPHNYPDPTPYITGHSIDSYYSHSSDYRGSYTHTYVPYSGE